MRNYTRKNVQFQEIEDVQSLCRLCLGKTEEMTTIFDANVDDVFSGLPMRIGTCLGLEVSRDDGFPKCICQLCNSELDKFYTFKKKCAANYRKIKASLSAVKKIDRRKNNDESNKKNTTTESVLDKDEKCNKIVSNEPLKITEQNETSIEVTPNKPTSREEQFSQENITLNKNEVDNTAVTELNREKCECLATPVSDKAIGPTSHNPLPVDVDVKQGFVNDNQIDDDNCVLDVGQSQTHDQNEKCTNINTMEFLPKYIVSALIEKGVLARMHDTLELLDTSINSVHLETGCGSEIILELVEEEPELPVDGSETSSHPNIFDPNLKSDGGGRCCGTCGMRFSTRGALVRHLRVHSGEKPFSCRTCGRSFAQREVLRRHELVHTDKLPYQCIWCPKAYTQRGALDAHARSHTPPDARPIMLHRCSHCTKMFLYPSGLSRHMVVHQGRDYPCDECSRTFHDKSSLQRHRRAHQRARSR